MLYSLIAAPIPAVNEPHYLCKARHYWQPEWCAGDFFLESANAHTVFFATVGALTQWCTLWQTALIGRLIALLVLALGWSNMLVTIQPGRWVPLLACWLFLALQACGNFSGEWLVGGVEGKVFGYGFLFAAIGQLNRRRVISAGALAGLAISFHPVIGIWGLLALIGTLFLEWLPFGIRRCVPGTTRADSASVAGDAPNTASGITVGGWAIGIGLLIICSLPGLLPAFRLLSEAVPDPIKGAANFIQVHYRLAHHLDPRAFLMRAYLGYAGLMIVWIVLAWTGQPSAAACRFNRLAGCAVLFAVMGILIGWSPYEQRAQLLKFYPFRLADLLVPVAVSIGIVRRDPSARWRRVAFACYAGLFVFALVRAHQVAEVNRIPAEQQADWIGACDWIDEHLPKDVLVFAPHNGWAFKWFARRAEYVAYKDCPQDAAGIVEWNRRLLFLQKWFAAHYDDEFYSAEELRDFRKRTGITHILTDRIGPLELDPVFQNGTYDIYDLTTLD